MIGDDPGEPNYDKYPTAYYQTWRWNLDRVKDRNENQINLVSHFHRVVAGQER